MQGLIVTLSRLDSYVTIGEHIKVYFEGTRGTDVRLRIVAPPEVVILRERLHQTRLRDGRN
jgi:sRNA-binding carbon storage regulator CsrA